MGHLVSSAKSACLCCKPFIEHHKKLKIPPQRKTQDQGNKECIHTGRLNHMTADVDVSLLCLKPQFAKDGTTKSTS